MVTTYLKVRETDHLPITWSKSKVTHYFTVEMSGKNGDSGVGH